tara:strand:- start:1688 stop:2602 length:915 start_codon:yes stop_codon:yes gene_type:complete
MRINILISPLIIYAIYFIYTCTEFFKEENIHVFTFATKSTDELKLLQKCVHNFGGSSLLFSESNSNFYKVIETKGKKAHAFLNFTHSINKYDFYVYVDGFDVIVQQSLHKLKNEFKLFLNTRGIPKSEGIVVMGEQNCWPWPKKTDSKTRGVSMQYMKNKTIVLQNKKTIEANNMCAHFESNNGLWKYLNSGTFMGSGIALKKLGQCYEHHMKKGQFEDQAILGLCQVENPNIVVDSESELFLSHYNYNKNFYSEEACKHSYLDEHNLPPYLLKTRKRPFILHFNGPSGRYRMKECMKFFDQVC